MSITAKELAEKLNLSQTAVSMALNNKPGVSTETRRMVVEAAEKYGYDFTRLSLKKNKAGSIYAVSYRSHNAIMSYSPIFDAMVEGMESVVQKDNYKLKVITFYEKRDNLEHYLGDLRTTDCVGIILFGTEMREEMVRPFLKLPFPVVILDAYFENLDCNYVVPNNRQGAYLATDYLISRRMKQPGYLQSAYPLRNFSERLEGFYHAVHDNGMSRSRCGIHLDIQIPYLSCLLNITEKSDIITGSLYSKAPDCMSLSKKNPTKGRNQRNSFACKIKVCIQNYHFIL